MATISVADAMRDALQTGFSKTTAPIIVAIEEAESGLNTLAHNTGTPGHPENSWGIAQINLLAHPDVSVTQATDPLLADYYALKLSNQGTNFTAWSTFNNGAYLQYLPGAQGTSPGPVVTAGGNSPGLGVVGQVLSALGITIPQNVVGDILWRAAFIGGGAILVIIGLILFIQPQVQDAGRLALEAM